MSAARRSAATAAGLSILLVPVATIMAPRIARAQPALEVFGGSSFSLPTPLSIRQRGREGIDIRAHYSTRPLSDAPYYAWRIESGGDGDGRSLDFVHHKLYLRDAPPDVQRFEVSHGYNLLTYGPRRRRGATRAAFGLGIVIAHPESTVRGESLSGRRGLLDAGYYISGVTVQTALGRRYTLGGRWFTDLEGRFTASFARVPVSGGSASVPNIALHTLAGLGVRP